MTVRDMSPDILIQRFQPQRRFLVFVRAGNQSLHREWFCPEAPRLWDLMLSYFEIPADGIDERAEIIAIGGVSKFTSIHALHKHDTRIFSRYDAILFLDDDVTLPFEDVNKLFMVFIHYNLLLAQPALTHRSFHSWTITLCCPYFGLRFTNFVEVMMPLFSRTAFMTCVETFSASVSSWGIDLVWPTLLGSPNNKIAIIDAIRATHHKPIDLQGGRFYEKLRALGIDPAQERDRIMQSYQVKPFEPRVLGALVPSDNGERYVFF